MVITIDSRTKEYDITEKREASRAIIKKDDQLLMIYIKTRNTYIFPGGGIEENETPEATCIREAKEEAGAIVNIVEYFGSIDELRDSKYGEMTYNLISHYYICDLIEQVEQELLGYEQEYGFEARWIRPIDALNHNLSKTETIYEPYLERNIKLLSILSEKLF